MRVEGSLSVMSFIPYIDVVELTRRATVGSRGTDPTVPPQPERATSRAHRWAFLARLVHRRAWQSRGAGSVRVGRAVGRPDREPVASVRGCEDH